MTAVGIIGGTGLDQLPGLTVDRPVEVKTRYGSPSSPLLRGDFHGMPVVFLARHGQDHAIPPHKVNYRANIEALHQLGVRSIVAVCAVGGIASWMAPGLLAVPDDVIDYTWGREHTYSDSAGAPLRHIEFTRPFADRVRAALIAAASEAQVSINRNGVIGVTQGPRLESAAEVRRLKQDGCDMVGMTTMPEAGLAAELGLDYAALALSVNWGAGIGSDGIHDEIESVLATGMQSVRKVLGGALQQIPKMK